MLPPELGRFLVLFFGVAALGTLVVLGVLGVLAEFVLRNRTRRRRLHQPVRVYYQRLLVSH